MGLGAVSFGAGLTAIVGDPAVTVPKVAALAAGVVLFLVGVFANTSAVRRRIAPLRSLSMQLAPLHLEGQRLDQELGEIPREQLDQPDLWNRLQDWDRRLSKAMNRDQEERWVLYKRAAGDLSPPGSSGWAEANRSNVQLRLTEIARTIQE
jgi:hypothetical protein